jgi:hypothetical protein
MRSKGRFFMPACFYDYRLIISLITYRIICIGQLSHKNQVSDMKKQFVLVSKKFGYDMFIVGANGDVTDKISEAQVFTYGEDNPEHKELAFNTMIPSVEFSAMAI